MAENHSIRTAPTEVQAAPDSSAAADAIQTAEVRDLAEEQSDSPEVFRELDDVQDDVLTLVSHFRLVDQRLYGDIEGVPDDLQAAAVVLHDATEALDRLHNRLDRLNVRMADLKHGPGWRERLRADMSTEQDTQASLEAAA